MEKDLSAVVLAGGRNSRMGGLDKGLLLFEGEPLAVRTLKLLEGIFEELVLVTNSSESYPGMPAGALRTSDLFPGQGPLAGIHAGLARSSRQAAFCVACDMPFLSAGFIRRLVRRFRALDCDVLLPRIGGEIEPLAAIYRRSLLPAIERLLADGQGNSVRRLFPAARTEYLELADTAGVRRLFTNLNFPEDIRKLCGA
jgi:molybdopterin-guanine dinucleotide biosynthesis protein A